LAQNLYGIDNSLGSSKTDTPDYSGAAGERRSLRHLSLWNYPEKFITIAWSQTIRKKAEGLHGLNLGKVRAVETHYVHTVKGFIRKETFFIPRDLAQGFDGSTLWFGIVPGLEREFQSVGPLARTRPSGRFNTPSSTHLRVN
jgi:hypothetical protein